MDDSIVKVFTQAHHQKMKKVLCSALYDNRILMVGVCTDHICFGLWGHKPIAVFFRLPPSYR